MTIKRRKYNSYDKYLKHQGEKLEIGLKKKIEKFMPSHFDKDVRSFRNRFEVFKDYIEGSVLCLGARLGCEVKALIDMGFKNSIGIDINPGDNNKFVIKGDFHHMEFDSNSYDTIYTNAIDHAWDLKLLSKEIFRVLKPGGKLILEIDHLLKKNEKDRFKLLKKDSKYESVLWSNIEDIKEEFKQFKFVYKCLSAYSVLLVVIFEKEKKY